MNIDDVIELCIESYEMGFNHAIDALKASAKVVKKDVLRGKFNKLVQQGVQADAQKDGAA